MITMTFTAACLPKSRSSSAFLLMTRKIFKGCDNRQQCRSKSSPPRLSDILANVPSAQNHHDLSKPATSPKISYKTPKAGDSVAVGMSGGVDSTVSAYLLSQQGFKVHGIFMHNWDVRDETGNCPSEEDYIRTKGICEKLGIPLTRVDFAKEYWVDVFEPFIATLSTGDQTPNPDVLCNRFVKFGVFARQFLKQFDDDHVGKMSTSTSTPRACDNQHMKFDWMAMGHYARLDRDPITGKVRLLKALDPWKDQSYYLSQALQTALARTILPVGGITKKGVKALATSIGLEDIAKQKESMGICFIGKRPFAEFVADYVPMRPGNFVTPQGKVVGKHLGLPVYTLGQSAKISGMNEKWYVARKNAISNEIVVVPSRDHPLLLSKIVNVKELHWISGVSPFQDQQDLVLVVESKFRYRTPGVRSTIKLCGSSLEVTFDEKQRGVTPGQTIVFYAYDQDGTTASVLLGSGTVF